MANPEHVRLLKEGATHWNAWRAANPDIVPDLADADFRDPYIARVKLDGADLSGADLQGAFLSYARLNKANLCGANLQRADLTRAKLNRAVLVDADLREAILERAVLVEADIGGADFSGARASGICLLRCDCADLDLVPGARPIRFDNANLSGANLKEAKFSHKIFNWEDKLPTVSFIHANLSKADLRGADCTYGNFIEADLGDAKLADSMFCGAALARANLWGAKLAGAHFEGAHLEGASLLRADATGASFIGADLKSARLEEGLFVDAQFDRADLQEALLSQGDFTGATLSEANLKRATAVGTNLTRSNLDGCHVHGISAWDLCLEGASQQNLVITPEGITAITADHLEIAQFIYLLLTNATIRHVIDSITSKTVLILGRFTPERKVVLDALRDALRAHNYVPIVFDFEKPRNRDFTETIKTLASMSLFVIADITNPKSSPLELQATIPDYMIPFVPIIDESEEPFSMFKDLVGKYDWVLEPLKYDSVANLVQVLDAAIIRPALDKHYELQERKSAAMKTRHISQYHA